MQEFTLARTLKEKSRIISKLKELKAIIARENSKLKTSPSKVNLNATWEEYRKCQSRLIKVKTAITQANVGIYHAIHELTELKAHIEFLRCSIDTTEGAVDKYIGNTVQQVIYVAHITREKLDGMIAETQDRIDALQDTIDAYNATTRVFIED